MSEFVVLVEAEADHDIATGIAERVFNEESPEWLVDLLHDKFCWIGLEPQTSFTCWSHFKEVENRACNQGYHRPRYLGHPKEGEAQKADFAIARRALLLVLFLKNREIFRLFYLSVIWIINQKDETDWNKLAAISKTMTYKLL